MTDFNTWLKTQPEELLFMTDSEAKELHKSLDELKQEHYPTVGTVLVDLWYILPDAFKWFARDADGQCYVFTDKPTFDEQEGSWFCGSNRTYLFEVTEFKNIKFPSNNLEEKPT